MFDLKRGRAALLLPRPLWLRAWTLRYFHSRVSLWTIHSSSHTRAGWTLVDHSGRPRPTTSRSALHICGRHTCHGDTRLLPHHNDLRLDWCTDHHNILFRGRLPDTEDAEASNLERYLVVAGHGAAIIAAQTLAGTLAACRRYFECVVCLAQAAEAADVIASAGSASVLRHAFLEVEAEALWRRRAARQVVKLNIALRGGPGAAALAQHCETDAVGELVVDAGLRAAACAAHEQLIRARQLDEALGFFRRRLRNHHGCCGLLNDDGGHLCRGLVASLWGACTGPSPTGPKQAGAVTRQPPNGTAGQ